MENGVRTLTDNKMYRKAVGCREQAFLHTVANTVTANSVEARINCGSNIKYIVGGPKPVDKTDLRHTHCVMSCVINDTRLNVSMCLGSSRHAFQSSV